MKSTLCFLFGIYMLLLSVLPCTDSCSHIVFTDKAETQVSSVKSNIASNHEASHDFCSPLCTCHCCSTVVAEMAPITLSFNPIVYKITKQAFYNPTSSPRSAILSMWQPPQLS